MNINIFKMKTKLIFIGTTALVFFLLFSCKKYSQNVPGEGFACETIQLNNYTIRKMDLNDSISYEKKTYLKEKEHFIISSITKLRFCNFMPIIFDKPQKKIFIYDQDGNCFSMIDNIGRGPNEYLQINDFCVDEASKSIYALVVTGGRKCAIYKYNLNGSLLGHSVLSFKAYKLEKLGNELFFYTDFSSDRRKGYNIYITNKEGQIINKHFPHDKRDQNWKSDINVFSVCNDTILFHPVFNDTIYKITAPEGIQASLVLRANDKSDNPDLLKKYCNSSLSDFMAYAFITGTRLCFKVWV